MSCFVWWSVFALSCGFIDGSNTEETMNFDYCTWKICYSDENIIFNGVVYTGVTLISSYTWIIDFTTNYSIDTSESYYFDVIMTEIIGTSWYDESIGQYTWLRNYRALCPNTYEPNKNKCASMYESYITQVDNIKNKMEFYVLSDEKVIVNLPWYYQGDCIWARDKTSVFSLSFMKNIWSSSYDYYIMPLKFIYETLAYFFRHF